MSIHNHEGTEAWRQGVFDAIGALQEALEGSDYSFHLTDVIIEALGLDQDEEEEPFDDDEA